jgi:hypothetical protein
MPKVYRTGLMFSAGSAQNFPAILLFNYIELLNKSGFAWGDLLASPGLGPLDRRAAGVQQALRAQAARGPRATLCAREIETDGAQPA